MGQETKTRSVGLRYGRGDLDRIQKIFHQFGASNFTIRDAKATVLPDMTSGEILKWSTAGVVTNTGTTKWTPEHTPVKTWRLSGTVIKFLERESV
jgi:hypothetical protein